ncbi:MAG TPA: type II toxin-antitoxin system RelE/ParE family toxin [Deltaproteobacteria bacterium]|jgi:plasmid stabilization system protein ParE|nr:type II toxin-antitoxin system RelE/ParE family toxin [Deltaproteobacteria bacterium]
MNIQFLEPAQAEFTDAVNYYNAQNEGLGFEFSDEIQAAIVRIIEYPEAWSLISKRTRRCRTKRFPYGIIYQVRDNNLLIIAVIHLHREPQSWKKRIPKRQQ